MVIVMEGMLCMVFKKMDFIFILTSPTVWSGVNESGYEIFSVLFSILLRCSMNLLNCSLAPYDLSKSSSSSRNRPALVFTHDKTVYSQFLEKECPHPTKGSCTHK